METINVIFVAFAIIYWLFAFCFCMKAAMINYEIERGERFIDFGYIHKLFIIFVMAILCVIFAPIAIGERLADKLNQ